MTDAPTPDIHSKPRRRLSWIWLVPIVAAIAGAVLVVRSYRAQGPQITISFETATGLAAGKTEVRFKDVVVGKVTDVKLGNEGDVIVDVSLRKSAGRLAVSDSRFWVVRPRFDTSGISGLGTLLSGAYIGVDAGNSEQNQRSYTGLETPPPVTQDQAGTRFQLVGAELGSLDVGSPVYYRHLEAGQVADYQLDEQGQQISLELFIRPPFDKFVNRQTRFWNASGIDVSVTGGSVSLQTQSLTTILLGGIAFENPPNTDTSTAPAADAEFVLYSGRDIAMNAAPQGDSTTVEFLFEQSIDGLSEGAEVQFMGVVIGEVSQVKVDYLPSEQRFFGIATAALTPQKLGPAYSNLLGSIDTDNRNSEALLELLISQGLRAQLQSANLLTGQQQIVLSMRPDSKLPDNAQIASNALRVPTIPGTLDALQVQVSTLLAKLQEIPFGDLGGELEGILTGARSAIAQLEETMNEAVTNVASNAATTMRTARTAMNEAGSSFRTLNAQLLPNASAAINELSKATQKVSTALDNTIGDEDALVLNELRGALQESERALRSVRDLADSIKRNPQQILLGKDEPRNPFDRGPKPMLRLIAPNRENRRLYSGPKR